MASLSVLVLTGCGSLSNLVLEFPGDPFGGVQSDISGTVSVSPLGIVGSVIDFPFSLVMDIVLLPWTLIMGAIL